jgi:hypothetical protein
VGAGGSSGRVPHNYKRSSAQDRRDGWTVVVTRRLIVGMSVGGRFGRKRTDARPRPRLSIRAVSARNPAEIRPGLRSAGRVDRRAAHPWAASCGRSRRDSGLPAGGPRSFVEPSYPIGPVGPLSDVRVIADPGCFKTDSQSGAQRAAEAIGGGCVCDGVGKPDISGWSARFREDQLRLATPSGVSASSFSSSFWVPRKAASSSTRIFSMALFWI